MRRTWALRALVLLVLLPRQLQPQSRAVVIGESDGSLLSIARDKADEFVRVWRYVWEVNVVLAHRFGGDPSQAPFPAPPGIREIRLPARDDSTAIFEGFRWDSLMVVANSRHPKGTVGGIGYRLLHCHPTPDYDHLDAVANPPPGVDLFDRYRQYIIESGVGRRAICPSWLQNAADTLAWDERHGIDGSLVAPLRDTVRVRRAELLHVLDEAAAHFPSNSWLAGQRVRFALDQGDTARAMRVAGDCRGELWWCDALRAYVGSTTGIPGDVRRADSLYREAVRLLPDDVWCKWTDLNVLLDEAGRRAYSRLPCAPSRDSTNDVIWWLSDPLYLEPGNERRVEHYNRHVLTALREGTGWHERWDMRERGGGAAVREMLVRYGWPSISTWIGYWRDTAHFRYLGIPGRTEDEDHGRFATAEYSPPRYHTVPAWAAIVRPHDASADDWDLVRPVFLAPSILLEAPQRVAVFERWGVQMHGAGLANDTVNNWWPREHMPKARPLVATDHQVGLFRRRDGTLLALASEVFGEKVVIGQQHSGGLILSPSPDSFRIVPRVAVGGTTAVFQEMIPARSSMLVGVEFIGETPKAPALRTRFGITSPGAVSDLMPGGLALSDVVLVRSKPTTEDTPIDPTEVLGSMQGSTRVSGSEPVHLYWEMYGIPAGQEVGIAITVEGMRSAGWFRRLGQRLGMWGRGGPGGISTSWRDSKPGVLLNVGSDVPTIGRMVTLDLSSQPLGATVITVTVKAAGKSATAVRQVEIRLP